LHGYSACIICIESLFFIYDHKKRLDAILLSFFEHIFAFKNILPLKDEETSVIPGEYTNLRYAYENRITERKNVVNNYPLSFNLQHSYNSLIFDH